MKILFLVNHISPTVQSSIMDGSRILGIDDWEVYSIPESLNKAKDFRKWYSSLEGDFIFACGEKAIRIVTDDYNAKLNKYRRFETNDFYCCVDANDRAGFLKDIRSTKLNTDNVDYKEEVYSLDLETSCLYPWDERAKILAISVNGKQVKLEDLGNLPTNAIIIGHNLKFDLLWLKRFGLDLSFYELYDTMIAEHLIDENSSKGLEDLIFKYTNFQNYWHSIDLSNISNYNLEIINEYNNLDSAITYLVAQKQIEVLKSSISQELFKFEMDKLRTLLQIEYTGMKVDRQRLLDKMKQSRQNLEEMSKSIHKIGININSGKQVGRYLYETLSLPAEYTDKGQYKTDGETLEKLNKSTQSEFLSMIVKYRYTNKLFSTYYTNILNKLDNKDLVHSNFNQAQVVTGRLSSSGGLNFQNLPARNKEDVESLFISRYKNGTIVKLDFSQMELRILADLSKDKNMLEAFNSGKDFHQATADLMGMERHAAKTLNFKIVYQGGSRQETDAWFKAFPSARFWIELKKEEFYNDLKVVSPIGRTRHFSEIKENIADRFHQERQACNSVIQGLASDITLLACWLLYLNEYKIINTVHDSIILDMEKWEENDKMFLEMLCEDEVKNQLEKKFNYKMVCPLKIDVQISNKSWGDCK